MKYSWIFPLILALIPLKSIAQSPDEGIYRIFVAERAEIIKLAQLGVDIIDVVPGRSIDVIIDREQLKMLEARGLKVEYLAKDFRTLMFGPEGRMPPEYHTYKSMTDELKALEASYSDIADLDSIGTTWEKRIIWALKISDSVDQEEDEAAVFVAGCHHGNEILSVEVPMYLINYLLKNYDADSTIAYLVDSREIWFVPMVNPDGHTAITRRNAHNVDINRNYSYQWGENAHHYGPYPFSEPESRAVRDLSLSQHFAASLSFHSSGRKVLYPWAYTDTIQVADSIAYREIGQALADSAGYEFIQSGSWYWHGGEHNDWQYSQNGVFGFTMELYTKHNAPASAIEEVSKRNLPGFLYLLRRVEGAGITGVITDSDSGKPLDATIQIMEVFDPYHEIAPRHSDPEFGRYRWLLSPGNYTVAFSKEGYKDTLVENVSVNEDSITILNISLKQIEVFADDSKSSMIPAGYSMDQNYPNPFNSQTEIGYSIPRDSKVRIEVYNVLGQKLINLVDGYKEAGYHRVSWNGKDSNGRPVSSGIYFYRMKAGDFVRANKMILIR